jgi:hypothetical protein
MGMGMVGKKRAAAAAAARETMRAMRGRGGVDGGKGAR